MAPAMAPKGKGRVSKTGSNTPRSSLAPADPTQPTIASVVDSLSFFYTPRPFKNPDWQKKKDAKPRARNLKQMMVAERERMPRHILPSGEKGEVLGYTTLHPPPSLLPPKKYCDITGLEAPYTDPKTALQYHSKEVYEIIKTLPRGADQQYLEIRGKNVIIK
ncbi:Uncharacterized conserved protein [Phaffia rhodozyma]|uniref:Uncharacterized conserved protein n=1 Tax=Phaffia rhodozyma TaxID=264483 RepID=A0A0F7SYG5_PHARH|nr:Uncharacterized conserved protein [Phaffia rhodozyma]